MRSLFGVILISIATLSNDSALADSNVSTCETLSNKLNTFDSNTLSGLTAKNMNNRLNNLHEVIVLYYEDCQKKSALKSHWTKTFELICEIPTEDLLPVSKLSLEKKVDYDIAVYESALACLQVTEGQVRKIKKYFIDKPDSKEKNKTLEILTATDQQLDKAQNQLTELHQDALITGVSSEEKLKNFSQQQLEAYSKREGFLAAVSTEESWFPVIYLGVEYLPDYDENGKNGGFEKQSLFARLSIDSRWDYPSSFIKAIHTGLDIEFTSEPIVSEESKDEDIGKISFNDVSNSMTATMYVWPVLYKSPTNAINISVGGRGGLSSRESLSKEGDSVNTYWVSGLRFIYHDYPSRYAQKNGMPRVDIELTRGKFEDYANSGDDKMRNVFRMAFRITENSPLFFQVDSNVGDGLDELSLSLYYGIKPENFSF